MGYQSKTYSLSDEVVEAIEAARGAGESPNQLLRRILLGDSGAFLEKVTAALKDEPKTEKKPEYRVMCQHCGLKFGADGPKEVLCGACQETGHRGGRHDCEACRYA